jgi:hypothetical protein
MVGRKYVDELIADVFRYVEIAFASDGVKTFGLFEIRFLRQVFGSLFRPACC